MSPTIQLIDNGQFTTTSGPFSEWNAFPDPAPSTLWNATTLLPASGSGGNIPFPTVSGYTPTPYTAPSTSAPPGNAAFVGFRPARLGALNYTLPALIAGVTYTLSFSYCNNTGVGGLTNYIAAGINMPDGVIGDFPAGTVIWKRFSSGSWLTRSITFTADQNVAATSASFRIWGGCTNGVVTNGSVTIGSGSIMSPILIANVSLTYTSTGQRLFPYGAMPVGTGPGTVASGGDSRFPGPDSQGNLRPRTERFDWFVAGTLSPGSTLGAIYAIVPSVNGVTFATVIGSVGSLNTPGTTTVQFDVLFNGASILSSGVLSITGTGTTAPGVTAASQFFTSSSGLLTMNIVGVASGPATNLTVSVWALYG